MITEKTNFQAKGQFFGLKDHLVSQTQVVQTQNLWKSDQIFLVRLS